MSLVATLMQPLVQRYDGRFDKNEYRQSNYGVYDTFVRDTVNPNGILSPAVRSAVTNSFGNDVIIPVINHEDVTIGDIWSCEVQPDENTSATVTLTFVDFSWGFTMYQAQHFNNYINYQWDFTKKMDKYILAFAAALDTMAYNILNTDKNQIFPADVTAVYPEVGDALQVSKAQENDFYNYLSAIMLTMDWRGPYNVVANTMHRRLVNFYQNQGSQNATNFAFQFSDYNFAFSNRIVNGSGVASTVFTIPEGNLAIVNRNTPDCLMGEQLGPAGDGTEWGIIQDFPIVGLPIGYKYNSHCGDVSGLHAGTAKLKASRVEEFDFYTQVCFVTAYNSDRANRYSPIVKAELLTT